LSKIKNKENKGTLIIQNKKAVLLTLVFSGAIG